MSPLTKIQLLDPEMMKSMKTDEFRYVLHFYSGYDECYNKNTKSIHYIHKVGGYQDQNIDIKINLQF